jgi:hypothetical protein
MKNIRTSLALIFTFLLAVQLVSSEEKRPSRPRFSLKVTGGWGSRVPIGDVNDCLASFNNNEVFEIHRKYETGQVIGEIKTLDDQISHWEAELRFDLTPRITFGIATSAPFHTRNQSSVTYTILGYAGSQIMTWTFRPEIRVSYPIKLSAYYVLPLFHRLSISVGGGVGVYPAKISQFRRYDAIYPDGDIGWFISSQLAKQNHGFGFHGNIILECSLKNRLALVAEFQARYVKISNFKGTLKASDHDGNSAQIAGTLYYFTEWGLSIGARYATLEIMEKPPELSIRFIKDIRKAVLDLNGYSLRIGLRIRLF